MEAKKRAGTSLDRTACNHRIALRDFLIEFSISLTFGKIHTSRQRCELKLVALSIETNTDAGIIGTVNVDRTVNVADRLRLWAVIGNRK